MKALLKWLRRKFPSKTRYTGDIETYLCHMVVLSETPVNEPFPEEVGRRAAREILKISFQYPELKRPTLAEARKKAGYFEHNKD